MIWRGAAAPRVAFLRKKLRKNLFGKGFLPPNGDGANMAGPIFEGRPVFAEGKDRQRLRFFGGAHLSLGGIRPECLERLLNWDLSVGILLRLR